MTDVDFYFDPVCPFAWAASRWLVDAAEGSDTQVTFRQMSLAVLNEGEDMDAEHQRMMERSRRLGRLFAAVAGKHGPDAIGRLYDALGTRIHVRHDQITAYAIKAALSECGLDESLSDALDDTTFDDEVKRAHQASQDVLGDTGGSPITAVDGRGFFGPVLTGIPSHEDGVRLLDAVLTATRVPEFSALQRPHQGPPATDEARR